MNYHKSLNNFVVVSARTPKRNENWMEIKELPFSYSERVKLVNKLASFSTCRVHLKTATKSGRARLFVKWL